MPFLNPNFFYDHIVSHYGHNHFLFRNLLNFLKIQVILVRVSRKKCDSAFFNGQGTLPEKPTLGYQRKKSDFFFQNFQNYMGDSSYHAHCRRCLIYVDIITNPGYKHLSGLGRLALHMYIYSPYVFKLDYSHSVTSNYNFQILFTRTYILSRYLRQGPQIQ